MWKDIRQMSLNPSFVIILTLVGLYLPWVFSITVVSRVSQSKKDCNEVCGHTRIPYPFYIYSASCGRSGFRLECHHNSTLTIKLSNVVHEVIDFLDDGIRLNLSCSSRVEDFSIQGKPNYAISDQNILQFGECMDTKHCLLTQMQCSNAEYCTFDRGCCYPLMNDSLWPVYSRWQHGASDLSQFYSMKCNFFTSWVASSLTPQVNAVFGLKLEWAVPGNCKDVHCHRNARCNTTTGVKGGVRCTCKQGYVGDGYADGKGCRKVCVINGETQYDDNCDSRKKETTIVSAVVVSASILVAVSIIFSALLIYRKRRKYLRRGKRHQWSEGGQITSFLRKQAKEISTELFTYKTLERATKGFVDAQKCGYGACGSVYDGFLLDGRHVAVKRMHFYSGSSQQWAHQLLNEINLLSTIKHPNLVQLLGCCLETDDPILVYEFIPNGTLAEHLQHERGDGLDWHTRCAIASDASQAIAYLHTNLNPPVYHRDIKSCNILLDFDFNCKVGDFGLSRLAPFDGCTHISTAPQGTPGYLDPEYHQTFHLTDKSDVYSFGVVLIEIISALKPVDFSRDKKEITLAALAVSKITSGCLDDIIDPCLQVTQRPNLRALVHRVVELAFRCLSHDKDSRPTMIEVAQELLKIRMESESLEDEHFDDSLSIDNNESFEKIYSSSSSVQSIHPTITLLT